MRARCGRRVECDECLGANGCDGTSPNAPADAAPLVPLAPAPGPRARFIAASTRAEGERVEVERQGGEGEAGLEDGVGGGREGGGLWCVLSS